jgi:signal transduction histidine kinase
MNIFRHHHIRKYVALLFLLLTLEFSLGYGKSYGMLPISNESQVELATAGDSPVDYFGIADFDKQELYDTLLIIIFLLLIFILLTFWLHTQRRKLRAMNIVLSEQRAEQELLLDEMRKKEREVSHLNHVQNRILSIVGHDLRGPLSSMYEIFRAYAAGDMKIQEEELDIFMKECYQQTGSIYFLAENLLFWAKNQHDGIESFPGNYSLRRMGEDAISLMQQVAGSKEIQIQLDIDDEARVHCDYNQISSVLRNLVSNSIKFTTGGGSVLISSRAIKDEYVITVSDNGVGMEQNKLDLMLRQRIGYTTKGTDNESGTGLGISLIAEFVEKNGGKLIGSSRPGHGTSFSFSLPVAAKERNEANSDSEV